MSEINEPAQIVRRAIEPAGCKKIDSVITPAKFAREIRDRHHFNDSDSDARQLCQQPQSEPVGCQHSPLSVTVV